MKDEEYGEDWQENIARLVYQYIEDCRKNKEFPHKAGLRVWLRYRDPNFPANKIQYDKIAFAIKALEDAGEAYLIKNGLENRINPVITKLILASNFGMRERIDTTSGDKPLPTPIYGGQSKGTV